MQEVDKYSLYDKVVGVQCWLVFVEGVEGVEGVWRISEMFHYVVVLAQSGGLAGRQTQPCSGGRQQSTEL